MYCYATEISRTYRVAEGERRVAYPDNRNLCSQNDDKIEVSWNNFEDEAKLSIYWNHSFQIFLYLYYLFHLQLTARLISYVYDQFPNPLEFNS